MVLSMIKMQILHFPGCSCCVQAIGYAENLKKEFPLDVETINMTKNEELVDKYNIRTSPAIVINGELVSVGETTEDEMRRHLQEAQARSLKG
jgi:glutaredoxin